MSSANRAIVARQTVDENITAGRHAPLSSCRPLLRSWIGNMQRFVELAPGIPGIQNVDALRSLMVSLLCFWANRGSAESDFVFLKNMSALQKAEEYVGA